MSKIGQLVSNIWTSRRIEQSATKVASMSDISEVYEQFEPYSLGIYYGEQIKRLDRKTIYTEYKMMMQDPTIHACLNLLAAAALGGHESRGEVVFIRPADKLLNDGLRAKKLRKLVESEAEYLQGLINNMVFAFTRNAIGYGDSYARVYGAQGYGLSHILCDDTVEPPFIQAFEQAGRTVGFHVLETNDYEVRRLTKLNHLQMVRMKMPRVTPLPQFRIDHVLQRQILSEDDPSKVPVIPSPVGGSFLQAVAPAWRDWMLSFAALNSQQIADSVNNQFFSLDMSSMPKSSRNKYKQGLQKSLLDLHEKVKSALKGGEPLWATNYTFLPSWSEKQVLNPLGDLTKRSAPLNLELAMTHLKRGVGALGLDLSLTGWMELISGGLGDGAAFHTSAQVMVTSALIRQALTEPLIDLCIQHFALKHGEVFKRSDLPFKIEFYSDISAAATEALNNKNTRASTFQMFIAGISGLREAELDTQSNMILLTEILGLDDTQALRIAKAVSKNVEIKKRQENGQPPPEPDGEDDDLFGDDDDDEGI